MLEYKCGQVVKSKAGHDKDELFLIIQVDQAYVYLVDGKRRRLEKPKKKKKKHIQVTKQMAEDFAEKIHHGERLTNAHIRNSLKVFKQKVK